MNDLKLSLKMKRTEKGQALVLIALAFIVLLAFIGLVVDVGTLFIHYGHLRRAVDAASLSAAAQFREFRTLGEMTASAQEFLRLNGVVDATAMVEVCDPTAIPLDLTLCTSPYLRKLVRVSATLPVNFSFLPVIGISTVDISASAVGEAASLDVVLVLDRSASMASDSSNNDPSLCNPTRTCEPFESVRRAAEGFINNLYFPYDRLAIVSFDRGVSIDQPLTDVKGDALATLNSLTVFPQPGNPPCDYNPNPPFAPLQPNPAGCTTTNIGGGLLGAASALTNPGLARYDSLWVVVLLTDGAANHTVAQGGFPNGYCPASTWFQPGCNTDPVTGVEYGCPICRDIAGLVTYHDSTSPHYDAEDYAVDQADALVALRTDSLGVSEMIIFTIGLGDQVVNTTYGNPRAGEELLQYVANAAQGSYYASATAADLGNIFSDIAQRIFTRIAR